LGLAPTSSRFFQPAGFYAAMAFQALGNQDLRNNASALFAKTLNPKP
jgi:hypothetical protein